MWQMIPAHICYRSLKYLALSSEIHLKPMIDKLSFNIRSLFHRAYVNVYVCESTYFYPILSQNRAQQTMWVCSVGGMCGPPWNCCHRRQVSSCGTWGHVLLWEVTMIVANWLHISSSLRLVSLCKFSSDPVPLSFEANCFSKIFQFYIMQQKSTIVFYRHSIEDKHNAFKKFMYNIWLWGKKREQDKKKKTKKKKSTIYGKEVA